MDRLVRPGADDPLTALIERTAAEAQAAGLTEAEVEAELAATNAERRGWAPPSLTRASSSPPR